MEWRPNGGWQRHICIISINCLSWNCRREASSEILSTLHDLLLLHKPRILILVETKVQSSITYTIIYKSHLINTVLVEVMGFSGGIWFLWDDNIVGIEVLSVHDQIVTIVVK